MPESKIILVRMNALDKLPTRLFKLGFQTTVTITAITISTILSEIAQGQNSIPNFEHLYPGLASGFGVDPGAPNPAKWLKPYSAFRNMTTTAQNSGQGTWKLTERFITSASELFDSRSESASIEADYLTYSGAASFEAIKSSQLSASHASWLVEADRNYGIHEQIDISDLQLTPAAQSHLTNYDNFTSNYGTAFISSWDRKAHLSAVFDVSNRSESDSSAISAMFAASGGFITGDFSAAGAMSEAVSKLSSQAQATLTISTDGVDISTFSGIFGGPIDLRTQFASLSGAITNMLSLVNSSNGFVSVYFLTPYAAVLPNFPNPNAIPKYPEQKKALRAWELAKATELQCLNYLSTDGPRRGLLDASEKEYLKSTIDKCILRENETQQWLRAFDADTSLLARDWLPIEVSGYPDIRWGAYQFFTAPLGQSVFPIKVEGGTDIGIVFDHPGKNRQQTVAGPFMLSKYGFQFLDSDSQLNQTRLPNGSLVRWYFLFDEYFDSHDPNYLYQYTFYLTDGSGVQISYGLDRSGTYSTPFISTSFLPVGMPPLSESFWSTQLYWELGNGGNGGLSVAEPIESATFSTDDTIRLAARSIPPFSTGSVDFVLDGKKVAGGPFVGSPLRGNAGFEFATTVSSVSLGNHTITVQSADGSIPPYIYGPIDFKVVPTPTAPTITANPASSNIAVGDTITMCATATGTGPFDYQWFRNGVQVFDNLANVSGTETSCMTIFSAAPTDAGRYQAVIRSPYGSATSSFAFLKFATCSNPVITVQPLSHIAQLGDAVEFHVSAENSTGYQWMFNGIPMLNETQSVLRISSVTMNTAGSYGVSIANGSCSTNSSIASLVVVGPARILGNGTDHYPQFDLPITGPIGAHLEIGNALQLVPAPIWNVSTNFNLSSQSYLFTDNPGLSNKQRFYRLMLLP